MLAGVQEQITYQPITQLRSFGMRRAAMLCATILESHELLG